MKSKKIMSAYAALASDLEVHASIGVSCYPDDGNDVESLFRHAGLALSQAKQSGGGRCLHFNAESVEQSRAGPPSALPETAPHDH